MTLNGSRVESEQPLWHPAEWPAQRHIRAGFTNSCHRSRAEDPAGFNLALHTGADRERALCNREQLLEILHLPAPPLWLKQVHGDRILKPDAENADNEADGCYTDRRGVVCAVLTADCIPLLLCDQGGTEIAAVHAGWRGLCNGVIGRALGCFTCAPAAIMAWLGPHICARHYEVGGEVRERCLATLGVKAHTAFTPTRPDHWQADLAQLAELALAVCGVTRLYRSGLCTYERADLLYSHRRDGNAGRFASLIWMTPE